MGFLLKLAKKLNFRPTQIIALGFLLAILSGAFLLWLPVSSANKTFTPFLDSLFTATSSVCVTGLVTVETAAHWNLFGKIVILVLAQLGGLGVVTVAVTFFVLVGKRITLKERMLVQEAYNLDTLEGMVRLILRIIKGTFIVEGIGAVFYAIVFIPEFGFLGGVFRSIFHSVSAFCNAGLDVIGGASFIPYVHNPIINFTTMFLIVAGGIGFTVWWDIIGVVKEVRGGDLSVKRSFLHLTLHSKLAILMTALLIGLGAVCVFIFEYGNSETIGELSAGQKVMASLFQSVTTRTAGFCTIDQSKMEEGTTLLSIILFYIGGSPTGTAGGVKTTTIGMLILTIMAVIKGKRHTEVFGRRIPEDNVRTGLAVIVISLGAVISACLVLFVTEDAEFSDILFEAFSAIGTVGLTRGLTPNLSSIGKCIIMLLMYIGRIGPITMVLAFGARRSRRSESIELPEKRIIVG